MLYIRCKKKYALSLIILQAFTILILTSGSGCHPLNKRSPLSIKSVIAPADVYESIEDKNRTIKYQHNLENIYHNVRNRYKPSQLEFFLVSGICFRAIQVKGFYDIYLSLNTKSSKIFLDSKTDLEQRASMIFKKYIKPLLKIAAKEREILKDITVAGIMINTRWEVKKTLKGQYSLISFEQVSLVTPKEQIDKYLRDTITDQELLDLSTLIAIKERGSPQIIRLRLK